MRRVRRFLGLNWGEWGFVIGENKSVGFHVVYGKWAVWFKRYHWTNNKNNPL